MSMFVINITNRALFLVIRLLLGYFIMVAIPLHSVHLAATALPGNKISGLFNFIGKPEKWDLDY